MSKTQKQLIALISVIFMCQLLFPQYSKADTLDESQIQKGLGGADKSVLLVKNSPQPIVFDGGTHIDMAHSGVTVTVSDAKGASSVSVASVDVVEDETGDDSIEDIKAYVLGEAKKRGLNPREVELIVKCESTWNPDAMHKNRNGSVDAGLWQINSIHKNLTLDEKLDYKVATKWALDKRLNDGNWSAWSCARRTGVM